MAITLTNEQLLNLNTALSTVADISEKETIPIELETWFIRLIQKSKVPLMEYNTVRDKILSRYGEEVFVEDPKKKDKEGNPLMVSTGRFEMTTSANKQKYLDELNELNNAECEIEGNVFKKKHDIYDKLPRLNMRTKLFLEAVLEPADETKPEIKEVDSVEK